MFAKARVVSYLFGTGFASQEKVVALASSFRSPLYYTSRAMAFFPCLTIWEQLSSLVLPDLTKEELSEKGRLGKISCITSKPLRMVSSVLSAGNQPRD